MANNSNLIIIGSGPGGYRAAEYAAHNGLTVTIVEAQEMGGTCLNCGCIPTKTLCRNAEVLDLLKHSATYGLAATSDNIDFACVMNRKQQVVEQLRSGIETLMSAPGITKVKGFARFIDAKTIEVNGEQYTADNIIIATGSSPKSLPIEGAQLPGVLNSTELLDIDHIPSRLCIIGAGVIGMEFASIFNSLGSQVTVVEFLKECLPVLDSDIAKRLRQTIGKRGVEFYMQSGVKSIEQATGENGDNHLVVNFERKGKPQQVCADTVLIATGRKSNVDGMQLENIGVDFSPKGINVNDDFLTNVSGIYAIGDVNGKCMLAHAATFQGLHAVNHILGKNDNIRFDIMPSAIFTYPEAASVGMSEDALKASGTSYECHKGYYRSNGKALAMNETEGLIKLLTDPSQDNLIVGCHAFGAHASDMVQEVTALMNSNVTMSQLSDMIHIHPTLSEIIHDMSL